MVDTWTVAKTPSKREHPQTGKTLIETRACHIYIQGPLLKPSQVTQPLLGLVHWCFVFTFLLPSYLHFCLLPRLVTWLLVTLLYTNQASCINYSLSTYIFLTLANTNFWKVFLQKAKTFCNLPHYVKYCSVQLHAQMNQFNHVKFNIGI